MEFDHEEFDRQLTAARKAVEATMRMVRKNSRNTDALVAAYTAEANSIRRHLFDLGEIIAPKRYVRRYVKSGE